jgi:hypothetical protein
MLDRKVLFGLRPPFDLIPKYKEKCERSPDCPEIEMRLKMNEENF